MLVRRTLQFALVATAVVLVLTVLWNVGLGVWDTGIGSGELTAGDVLSSYLLWGRWANLATLLLFAALLLVAPLLPGGRRAGHVLIAGAGIALVGDLVTLSGVSDVSGLVFSNQLPTEFVAGRVIQFSAEAAPNYVWGAGVILMGVGLLVLAVDAENKEWTRTSAVLGVAFGAMGLTDMGVFGTKDIAWIVALATTTFIFYWLLVALRVTTASDEPARRVLS